MSSSGGFHLDGEVEIPVACEFGGTRWVLRHFMRQPTDAEWMAYQRALTGVRLVGGAITEDPTRASADLKLWEACIVRVDDQYLWQGRPVMEQADWKSKIPGPHKAVAAYALVDARRQLIDGPLA